MTIFIKNNQRISEHDLFANQSCPHDRDNAVRLGGDVLTETPQPAIAFNQTATQGADDFINKCTTWVVTTLDTTAVAARLAELKANAIRGIDSDTDAIYGAVLGNRGIEYQDAGTAATAYKAAGYSGTVPSEVQSWATAKAQTAQWAADDILSTATAWKIAQDAIRSTRLTKKEAVRNSADATAVATILAAWSGFVAYIRGQLGV